MRFSALERKIEPRNKIQPYQVYVGNGLYKKARGKVSALQWANAFQGSPHAMSFIPTPCGANRVFPLIAMPKEANNKGSAPSPTTHYWL